MYIYIMQIYFEKGKVTVPLCKDVLGNKKSVLTKNVTIALTLKTVQNTKKHSC